MEVVEHELATNVIIWALARSDEVFEFLDTGRSEDDPRAILDATSADRSLIEEFVADRVGDVEVSLFTRQGLPIGIGFEFLSSQPNLGSLRDPSLRLVSDDGRESLIYLTLGEEDKLSRIAADMRPQAGDSYRIVGAFPLPVGKWSLAPETKQKIEIGEPVALYSAEELIHAFLLPDVGDTNANPSCSEASAPVCVSKIKDAEIYGDLTDDILKAQVQVSIGADQNSKNFKTFPACDYGVFLQTFLVEHKAGTKDGQCFVTGALAGKRRNKNDVTSLFMMGLDCDSGNKLDEVVETIQKLGLHAVLYTTHSHGVSELVLKKDRFMKWAEKNGHDTAVTTENIRAFLIDEDKYQRKVIDQVEYRETSHIEGGVQLLLSAPPIDKFRIVFLLEKPFVIADQTVSQAEAILLWERKILGLGDMLGIKVDRSARDPSRLFFLPRHKKGAKNQRIIILGGKKLPFEIIPEGDLRGAPKAESDDPFEQAGAVLAGRLRGRAMSPTLGIDLRTWAASRGDGFMIHKVFEDYCDDRIRVRQSDSKFTCECPFDEGHSNAGDPDDAGCYIEGAGDVEQFAFRCRHDSCAGRDRLTMLEKAMNDGWFPESVLNDAQYDAVIRDDDEENDQPSKSRRANEDLNEIRASIASTVEALVAKGAVDGALLTTLCDLLVRAGNAALQAEVGAELKRKIKLTQKSFEEVMKEARQKSKKSRSEAEMNLIRSKSKLPIINSDDHFDEKCLAILDGLNISNIDPFMFTSHGVPVRLSETNSGRKMLSVMGEKEFAHECNNAVHYFSGDGDTRRKSSLPLDTIRHLMGAGQKPFPKIERIVHTPIHGADGSLRTRPGYDSTTKCYFDSQGMVIPEVPHSPTSDDVAKARNLLFGNALIDFPFVDDFDGSSPDAGGRGSRANAVAMILQPFVRALYGGASPAYFIDKPAPGTGSGYLVDTAFIINCGERAQVQGLSANDEEVRKNITSKLIAGDLFVFFDNLKHKLNSASLAAFVTASSWTDRRLGKSEVVHIDINCTTILTANNVRLEGEQIRRMAPIRLDARTDRPDERPPEIFKHNPFQPWLLSNRARLVWACLVLVQNWFAKGQPPGAVSFASFEDYARVMGGILAAAEIEGFLSNLGAFRQAKKEDDADEIEMMQALFDHVSTLRKAERFTTTDAYDALVREDICQYACLNIRPGLPLKQALGSRLLKYVSRGFRLRMPDGHEALVFFQRAPENAAGMNTAVWQMTTSG